MRAPRTALAFFAFNGISNLCVLSRSQNSDPRYLQIYELSQRDYFPNQEVRNSVYGNPRSQGLIAAVKSTVSLYDRLR